MITYLFHDWLHNQCIIANSIDSESKDGDLLIVVVASLLAVYLVSLVTIFIVGFVGGRWFERKFKGPLNQPPPPNIPPVPIYETMLPDDTHEGQIINLEENVAYGHVTVL